MLNLSVAIQIAVYNLGDYWRKWSTTADIQGVTKYW